MILNSDELKLRYKQETGNDVTNANNIYELVEYNINSFNNSINLLDEDILPNNIIELLHHNVISIIVERVEVKLRDLYDEYEIDNTDINKECAYITWLESKLIELL